MLPGSASANIYVICLSVVLKDRHAYLHVNHCIPDGELLQLEVHTDRRLVGLRKLVLSVPLDDRRLARRRGAQHEELGIHWWVSGARVECTG